MMDRRREHEGGHNARLPERRVLSGLPTAPARVMLAMALCFEAQSPLAQDSHLSAVLTVVMEFTSSNENRSCHLMMLTAIVGVIIVNWDWIVGKCFGKKHPDPDK